MADLMQHVREAQFPFPERVIHLFVGGSELHGAKVHGTDDLDIYGVYVEPPDLVLGLESFPHFVCSTAGNDRRNGPQDVDITLYSLKKWAGLACKGNPTALHFLFAEGVMRSSTWKKIVANRGVFLSRTFVKPFLGFADDQLKRMTGKKGSGKKGQRPEIETKYGYDVKAAMHTLRLLYECKELLLQGTITLPRPERSFLIKVRTGKYSMDSVLFKAQELVEECEQAARNSQLPEKVDRSAISCLLADSYRGLWDARWTPSSGKSLSIQESRPRFLRISCGLVSFQACSFLARHRRYHGKGCLRTSPHRSCKPSANAGSRPIWSVVACAICCLGGNRRITTSRPTPLPGK